MNSFLKKLVRKECYVTSLEWEETEEKGDYGRKKKIAVLSLIPMYKVVFGKPHYAPFAHSIKIKFDALPPEHAAEELASANRLMDICEARKGKIPVSVLQEITARSMLYRKMYFSTDGASKHATLWNDINNTLKRTENELILQDQFYEHRHITCAVLGTPLPTYGLKAIRDFVGEEPLYL